MNQEFDREGAPPATAGGSVRADEGAPALIRTLTKYRLMVGTGGQPELTTEGVDHPYAGPIVCRVEDVLRVCAPSVAPEAPTECDQCEALKLMIKGLQDSLDGCTKKVVELAALPRSPAPEKETP